MRRSNEEHVNTHRIGEIGIQNNRPRGNRFGEVGVDGRIT
jgi:hypothetical protein